MRRAIIGLFLLGIILGFGSLGYVLIEDADPVDALYMTVITITSVGYGEVIPLSRPGRVFTMALIIIGVSFVLYLVGQITEAVVEGGLAAMFGRQKMEKRVAELSDHYIVCGFGRIGKVICRMLTENSRPFVVIENQAGELRALEEAGYLFLEGNAAEDQVLIKAGIHKARGLVSVVSSDADNVYITLSARGLNKDLFIMARSAAGEGAETKLLRAGANRVVSPYDIGARRMASLILRPTVSDFVDLTVHAGQLGLRLEEAVIGPTSSLVGLALKDSGLRPDYDLIVVAIQRQGRMLFNPSPLERLAEGDILVVLGEHDNLERFNQIL
ncbi:MAG: NAD-binding protein [Thermodesulfobacteriota bacterium]